MSSTWSSGVGKFVKKDPNHGNWWRKIKHWLCKVGLCNLDKCNCDCHPTTIELIDAPLESKKKVALVKKWEGSKMVTKEVEVDE